MSYPYKEEDPLNFLSSVEPKNLSPEEREEIREKGCLLYDTTGEKIDCYGPIDLDHVSTQGAGNLDTIVYDNKLLPNLVPLCRKHHVEKGSIGYSGMIEKYSEYEEWLRSNGREDIFLKAEKSKLPEIRKEDIPF